MGLDALPYVAAALMISERSSPCPVPSQVAQATDPDPQPNTSSAGKLPSHTFTGKHSEASIAVKDTSGPIAKWHPHHKTVINEHAKEAIKPAWKGKYHG